MTMLNLNGKKIMISRTDSIGDVVLTLPLCVLLKQRFPDCEIHFLGMNYTRPVLECLPQIDQLHCWDAWQKLNSSDLNAQVKALHIDYWIHVFPRKEIAKLVKKAGIPHRIGTSHRLFHLLTCNHRVHFTRKNSPLHEAQLNFELLKPLGLDTIPALNDISSWISTAFKPVSEINNDLPQQAVILHPKSKGSALEWPIEQYLSLANHLLDRGEKVLFCGTEAEGALFRKLIPDHPNCHDLSGKLSLAAYINLIKHSKALVACSTGPYHLAGVCGIRAIGLFVSRRPIHPGRWKALGPQAVSLVFDPECQTCAEGKTCTCIEKISVQHVLDAL